MSHERFIKPGEKPYRGKDLKSDTIKFLRIGVVDRVDYESGYLDIIWQDEKGLRSFIPIPASFGSKRATMRGMPEIGSQVLCGWKKQTPTLEDPVVISFIDTNLQNDHDYRLIRTEKTPSELKEVKSIREKIGYDIVRGKRRKIYPGEIHLESTHGAELYLDENVYLSNNKLNEIEIRSADQSIRISTKQLYSTTQSARTYSGMVVREPGSANFSFQPSVLSNGQKIQIITESNNPFHLGGLAYTENRTEIFEKSDGLLKISEVNAGYDVSPMDPYISFVLGTLVGNDKVDTAKYAKLLRPQVFSTIIASDPSLDYIECTPDEYNKLSSAFHLKFHKSRAQIDIDKEGHLFTYFPASSGIHPFKEGRSWEAAFDGSIKMAVGADKINTVSMYLDTRGGIRENLGFDDAGKSKITIAQKGVHLQVLAPSDDGNAYYIGTTGNYRGYITGNYNLEVTGDYTVTVHGKIQEEILGIKVENYVNDKNVVYGGSFKTIVIKDVQEQIGWDRQVKITGLKEQGPRLPAIPSLPTETTDKYDLTTGSRVETYTNGSLKRKILLGNKETEILTGDIIEKITTKGDRKLTLTLGNQEDSLTKGDNKTTIAVGNDITEVTTGDIKRQIDVGSELTTVTTGDIKETITQGNRVTEITQGDEKVNLTQGNNETTVLTGSIKETITTGDNETVVTSGNIKENITTGDNTEAIVSGNKEITITSGNFKVAITAGNIDIKTTAGTIKIATTTQQVTVQGMLKVTIKSGVKIECVAPQVSLGQMPTKGGVITGLPVPSHLDFLCGIPLLSSKTVKASI